MKWSGGRQSSNVEDRSGRSAGSGGKIMAGGLPHSEILGSKPCWRLPEAYRILKRPSSVLSAKASTMRPCGRHSQRPCHPAAFLIARLPDDKS